MKKLLIEILLALSFLCVSDNPQDKNFVKQENIFNDSQDKNFVKQWDKFDYRKKVIYCKAAHMANYGDNSIAFYDLNDNEKIDHIAVYDFTRSDSTSYYALEILELMKEITLEELYRKRNMPYIKNYFLDADGDGTLETKLFFRMHNPHFPHQ